MERTNPKGEAGSCPPAEILSSSLRRYYPDQVLEGVATDRIHYLFNLSTCKLFNLLQWV